MVCLWVGWWFIFWFGDCCGLVCLAFICFWLVAANYACSVDGLYLNVFIVWLLN